MTSIVVLFPKIDDAKSIKNLLIKCGFQVSAVCSTGAQAIAAVEELNDGIVVCGYKYMDMMYSELHTLLPRGFEMLLMASKQVLTECQDNDIVCLTMPLKVHEMVDTVNMMVQSN